MYIKMDMSLEFSQAMPRTCPNLEMCPCHYVHLFILFIRFIILFILSHLISYSSCLSRTRKTIRNTSSCLDCATLRFELGGCDQWPDAVGAGTESFGRNGARRGDTQRHHLQLHHQRFAPRPWAEQDKLTTKLKRTCSLAQLTLSRTPRLEGQVHDSIKSDVMRCHMRCHESPVLPLAALASIAYQALNWHCALDLLQTDSFVSNENFD